MPSNMVSCSCVMKQLSKNKQLLSGFCKMKNNKNMGARALTLYLNCYKLHLLFGYRLASPPIYIISGTRFVGLCSRKIDFSVTHSLLHLSSCLRKSKVDFCFQFCIILF